MQRGTKRRLPQRIRRGGPSLDLRALPAALCLIAALLLASPARAIVIAIRPNTESEMAGGSYVIERNGAEVATTPHSPVAAENLCTGTTEQLVIWNGPQKISTRDTWTARARSSGGATSPASAPARYCAQTLRDRPWWPIYSPRPAAAPVRQPWHPVYRKGH